MEEPRSQTESIDLAQKDTDRVVSTDCAATTTTTTTTTMSTTSISPFLQKIPVELRNPVYKSFFTSSTATIPGQHVNAHIPGAIAKCINLLLTCKTIYAEAKEYFFTHTQFLVPRRPGLTAFHMPIYRVPSLTISNPSRYDLGILSLSLLIPSFGSDVKNLTLVSASPPVFSILLSPTLFSSSSIYPPVFTLNSPSSPLGTVRKLTQILVFKRNSGNVDVPLVLHASNPRNRPQYSIVELAIITTVRHPVTNNITTELEIFAPIDDEVRRIWKKLMDVREIAKWLVSVSKIVVYLTVRWPYERFEAAERVGSDGKRVIS